MRIEISEDDALKVELRAQDVLSVKPVGLGLVSLDDVVDDERDLQKIVRQPRERKRGIPDHVVVSATLGENKLATQAQPRASHRGFGGADVNHRRILAEGVTGAGLE